jgi:hypothetical protein
VNTKGVYDMDCSGFVDYLLQQIAPAQFAPLRIEPGHTRPRAAMYFDLFTRLTKSPLPRWEAVPKLGEVRRGDIIAWELAASTDKTAGIQPQVRWKVMRFSNGSRREGAGLSFA